MTAIYRVSSPNWCDPCIVPADRKKIDWRRITDLRVGSRTEAIEKLKWYALRRKVELLHVQHAKARQKTLSHYLIKIAPQLRDLLVWASGGR